MYALVLHYSWLACLKAWEHPLSVETMFAKYSKHFWPWREQTKYGYVLAVAEKRASMWLGRCATCCIWRRATWGTVAMTTLQQEHRQVGTWNVLVGSGHKHGQHATTERTEEHNILCNNRRRRRG
jgi:hypothetical protein